MDRPLPEDLRDRVPAGWREGLACLACLPACLLADAE